MSQIFDITLGRWRPLTTADLAGGGGGNGGTSVTNLTATVSPTSVVVVSDTGTDATIPLADSTNAGAMTPEAVVQLAGLGSAAEADVADFATANHTHALLMTTDERTKLTALPAAADLSTSLAGKMPNTMTGLQTVINGGTPAEKAALQSSVSGATVASGLRLIANRCGIDTHYISANKQIMCRSRHTNFEGGLSSAAVGFYNGYVSNSSPYEMANGGVTTYQAQIEDAAGVILASFTWDGAASKNAASGELIISDYVALSRPLKYYEQFFIAFYRNSPNGICYSQGGGNMVYVSGSNDSGECCTFAVTTPNRIGTGGPFASSQAGVFGRPALILGRTLTRSYAVWGDSRQGQGVNYHTDVGGGFSGEALPSIGPIYPSVALSYGGAKVQNDLANKTIRLQIGAYCTDSLIAYGINDATTAGRTAPLIMADMQALAAAIGVAPWLQTLAPKTDASNTTTDAVVNPIRVALNLLIRRTPAWAAGYFELADVVESARDSGLWKTGYTTDGLHEIATGAAAIAASRVMVPRTRQF